MQDDGARKGRGYMKRLIYKAGLIIAIWICVWLAANISCDSVYAKDADGDYVVLIDPGHGGADPGAVSSHISGNGSYGGVNYERTLNWNIAMALKAELQTYEGVKVYLSRGYGEYSANCGRAVTGKILNSDLNISVHNNSAGSSSARGVIVYGTVDSRYKASIKNLCLAISKEVSTGLGIPVYGGGYGARTSSSGGDYYTFLGESSRCNIPSIIIEHCYISNKSDAAVVQQLSNQYKMGAADATAIAKYLGLKKRTVSADSSVTLTRTYGAYMNTSKEGAFSSSDTAVAEVRSDGLIVARSTGNAVITHTATDGSKETVSVTVPAVRRVAISAGLVQKQYRTDSEALNYDKTGIVVKSINSDGSAEQIMSGYELGAPYISNKVSSSMAVYTVDVSYQGMTCPMNYYCYYSGTVTSHNPNNAKPTASNKDIYLMPVTYTSGVSGEVPTMPSEFPTVVPEKSTEKETPVETQSPKETATGTTVSEEQTTVTAADTKTESEYITEVSDIDETANHSGGADPVVVVCIVLLVILVIAGGITGYIYMKRKGRI